MTFPLRSFQKNLFGSLRSVESRRLVVRASQGIILLDCDGLPFPGKGEERRRIWLLQGAPAALGCEQLLFREDFFSVLSAAKKRLNTGITEGLGELCVEAL